MAAPVYDPNILEAKDRAGGDEIPGLHRGF